jgi:hypothetical protein
MLPRHPDTIPNLAADCRRLLRDEYLRIQTLTDKPLDLDPRDTNTPRWDGNGRCVGSGETQQEYDLRVAEAKEERRGRLAAAIAEYRRVAALWGVDLD